MSVRTVTVTLVLALLISVLPSSGAFGVESAPPETVTDEFVGFRAAQVSDAGLAVSEVVEAPIPFTMLGFGHADGTDVDVRVSADGSEWSEWYTAEAMGDEEGPDAHLEEADAADAVKQERIYTEPVWTGEARYLQVRVPADALGGLAAEIIDSDGVSRSLFQRVRDAFQPGATSTAEASPNVISRAQWGADESWRRRDASTSNPRFAVVHHTAGGNSYSAAESAAVVRGIYSYHARTLGWNDIGYNFLVDRYGRVYEGRAGGIHRGVIGAHAEGFNTGSIGIAIMGNFQSVLPPAVAQEAVAQTLAWKFALHGIQPNSTVTVTSGGSNKYAKGTSVRLNTIIGHRDVGQTACPGNQYYGRMPALRNRVEALVPNLGPFPDVSPSRFYGPGVEWMAEHGITDGFGETGTFRPDNPVTRAEMVAFLWRMMDQPTGYPAHRFPDVPSGRYYEQALRWAKAEGITDGYGNTGRFAPNRTVSRGEMVTFLHRTAGSKPGAPRHAFPDVKSSDFFDGAVSWARLHAITDGYGSTGRFEPKRDVTRGETAAFMHRLASVRGAWAVGTRSPSTAVFNN